ncbi:MAG: alkaline phosphatase family protein [Candidatus Hydrogenedentales bacterium]
MGAQRVMVIGLDCASPCFVFGPHKPPLPFLDSLMPQSFRGVMRSCDPPITVPAWSCMFTGRDPGELGCYGFRDRTGWGYDQRGIASAAQISAERIWDSAGRAGKKCVVLGVPQTYPIAPVNGCLVSGLLTPSDNVEYTYPPELNEELRKRVGPYSIDVDDYRTDDKSALLPHILRHLDNRFAYARYLCTNKSWDLFVMVETGLDRLQHAFWQYADPRHPRYERNSEFQNVVSDYYRRLDGHVAKLVALAGEDLALLIVSDHGAKSFHGMFRLNSWLMQEGHLRLRHSPEPNTALNPEMVDWSQTRAWGEGGYCGRIYINRRGREPQGTVDDSQYEALREELTMRLEQLPVPDRAGPTRVLRPEQTYLHSNGFPSDLFVYAGDLFWRCSGSVGSTEIFSTENDTGPDGANHDHDGIAILHAPGVVRAAKAQGLNLLDVTPTLRDLLALGTNDDLRGRSWLREHHREDTRGENHERSATV